jgi:hypothetical protein
MKYNLLSMLKLLSYLWQQSRELLAVKVVEEYVYVNNLAFAQIFVVSVEGEK